MQKEKITKKCLNDFLGEGLSQSQVAKACGMSRQAVNQRIAYVSKHGDIRARRHSVVFLRRLGFLIPEIMDFTGYGQGNIIKLLGAAGYSSAEGVYGESARVSMKRFKVKFLYRIGFTLPDICRLTKYRASLARYYLYSEGYSLKGRTAAFGKSPKFGTKATQ